MPDSEKIIDPCDVDDISALVPGATNLAGFRKQAAESDWQVDPRELRRSMRMAYQRVTGGSERARVPNDAETFRVTAVQTALRALGIGAGAEGVYDPSSTAPVPSLGQRLQTNAGAESPLTRQELVVRQLIAETKDDKVALRLVQHATPNRLYRWPETALPIQLLDILTLVHVTEQLDRAAMVANALFCSALEPDDRFWDFIGLSNAYFFRIGQEGWQQFAQGLGLDADSLVERNNRGVMLNAYGQKICAISPSVDELRTLFAKNGHAVDKIIAAEDVAQSWREAFLPIFQEPKRR